MSRYLSRREKKIMAKNEKMSKTSSSINLMDFGQRGILHEIEYAIINVIAVFIFPFWLIYQNLKEWKDGARRH